ncbi:hypothetical protein SLEP1_g21099 [Rubroshorea leprosula]|uniref:Uncharacterized protein n=1 Tax=Rubroshorea leprosula TaxID=152421 RepID=A0AAV5JAW3_9ROSI|nr:hypothetical protein SLEP1_g21099 [Rubroshorea leprosula]
MKKFIRKLSRAKAARSLRFSIFGHEKMAKEKQRSDVPKGYFPIYAGVEEVQRFVVSAKLLSYPIFVELLKKSYQEYGYEQGGVLRIPIQVFVFEHFLDSLKRGQKPLTLDEMNL